MSGKIEGSLVGASFFLLIPGGDRRIKSRGLVGGGEEKGSGRDGGLGAESTLIRNFFRFSFTG